MLVRNIVLIYIYILYLTFINISVLKNYDERTLGTLYCICKDFEFTKYVDIHTEKTRKFKMFINNSK